MIGAASSEGRAGPTAEALAAEGARVAMCARNEKTLRAAADAIASNGMKQAGYTYVNIDDCWQGKRDAEGKIQPNDKFPDMKGLVDYIHSKGLKAGIYSSPGNAEDN